MNQVLELKAKVKVKVSVLSPGTHDYMYSSDFTIFPGKVGANVACNYWSILKSVHQLQG